MGRSICLRSRAKQNEPIELGWPGAGTEGQPGRPGKGARATRCHLDRIQSLVTSTVKEKQDEQISFDYRWSLRRHRYLFDYAARPRVCAGDGARPGRRLVGFPPGSRKSRGPAQCNSAQWMRRKKFQCGWHPLRAFRAHFPASVCRPPPLLRSARRRHRAAG